jgi:hypothetical protein
LFLIMPIKWGKTHLLINVLLRRVEEAGVCEEERFVPAVMCVFSFLSPIPEVNFLCGFVFPDGCRLVGMQAPPETTRSYQENHAKRTEPAQLTVPMIYRRRRSSSIPAPESDWLQNPIGCRNVCEAQPSLPVVRQPSLATNEVQRKPLLGRPETSIG